MTMKVVPVGCLYRLSHGSFVVVNR